MEKSAEDDSPNGGSPMVIDGTTFSDTYNTAVQVKASGVKIHGNAVTNATNGGFMVSGSANNITDNLVFGIKGKRNMFFDVGNFGYTLSGTGKWHRNIAADVEFTASGWMVAAVMQIIQSHWIRTIYPMFTIFACTTRVSVLLSKPERRAL